MDFIKNYIVLDKFGKNYYPIKNSLKSSLNFLVKYLSSDYSKDDTLFLHNVVMCYNITFIYNDFYNSIFYIGFSEWEISDGEMDCPEDEEFASYVNESNSCKISYDNFFEFIKKWDQLKQELLPFAIIYRDKNDWIDCKGFNLQEEMELFVEHNTQSSR